MRETGSTSTRRWPGKRTNEVRRAATAEDCTTPRAKTAGEKQVRINEGERLSMRKTGRTDEVLPTTDLLKSSKRLVRQRKLKGSHKRSRVVSSPLLLLLRLLLLQLLLESLLQLLPLFPAAQQKQRSSRCCPAMPFQRCLNSGSGACRRSCYCCSSCGCYCHSVRRRTDGVRPSLACTIILLASYFAGESCRGP